MRLLLLFMSTLAPLPSLAIAADPRAPWLSDLGDGRYQNPVLFADYSDPDAIRVGEDYWLTSSSFSHVPGLPILHSRDLVNWTIVNHALPALDYRDASGESLASHFSVPRHGAGVWAPSIRHHAGKFWIYYPDPDFGLYLVTATDPRGAWSAPILVKAGRGLIDPCPLWDDDGKVYLVHGWARSRAGKSNLLQLNQLSPDGTRVIDGNGVVIVDENISGRGWHTLEGPKFYKRGDTYWILAPVNGVATGSQAVYRAKNIRGPYEARVVLQQGSTPINGPHQGAWVATPTGEDWFLHFQDRGPFGRVVHLQPMSWSADGWPRMGSEKSEPVLTHQKPEVGTALRAVLSSDPRLAPAATDEFDTPTLGLQWQWQANPRPEFFSLTARPGFLRLAVSPRLEADTLYSAPQLLLQKFPAPAFTATAALDFSSPTDTECAGLIVFGYDYAWVGLANNAGKPQLVMCTNKGAQNHGKENEVARVEVSSFKAFLRVTVNEQAKCRFSYSLDGKSFVAIGDEFAASVGKWVGAKVGLFAASGPIVPSFKTGHADFDFFRIAP